MKGGHATRATEPGGAAPTHDHPSNVRGQEPGGQGGQGWEVEQGVWKGGETIESLCSTALIKEKLKRRKWKLKSSGG